MQKLEELLLGSLSFYEAMSFSKIVFDLDSEVLKAHPDFDKDQMLTILQSLEKRGLVKSSKSGTEQVWIRIHPRRSWWKRLFPF